MSPDWKPQVVVSGMCEQGKTVLWCKVAPGDFQLHFNTLQQTVNKLYIPRLFYQKHTMSTQRSGYKIYFYPKFDFVGLNSEANKQIFSYIVCRYLVV